MIKILICCGGGFSSSALALKMRQELEKKNLTEKVCFDFSPFVISHEVKDQYDVIMCCPHLRYKIPSYNEEYIHNEKPIYVLPPVMYGTMEAEEVYQDALDILELFKTDQNNPICFPNEEDITKVKRLKSYRKVYKITGSIKKGDES